MMDGQHVTALLKGRVGSRGTFRATMASYDPQQLTWNTTHTTNREGKYCYCGHDRRLDELSLQCKGTDLLGDIADCGSR